jgi:hypothetical protein
MGRGWYRRRHVDRDFCGHPGANPGGRFTLHILRGRCAARPGRSPFLADEAAALRGQAIGDPPELIPGGSGKYGGRVAYGARRPRPAANGVLAR